MNRAEAIKLIGSRVEVWTSANGCYVGRLVEIVPSRPWRGVVGHEIDKPAGTVTSTDHHGLVSANLVKFRGDSDGGSLGEPLPTITSGQGAARPAGAAHALGIDAAYLVQFNYGQKQWHDVESPLVTVPSQGLHFGLVYAFLVKYFGTAIAASAADPAPTVTTKERFGVVMVQVAPGVVEPAVSLSVTRDGVAENYVIADIGLRMLTPRELARAQGFPDTYILTGTKSQQVAKIGNSVCPIMAKVMVEANFSNTYARAGR